MMLMMLSNINLRENKGGFIGSLLLVFLILMTCYALFFIPSQSRLHWNNPLYWSDNPKVAYPELDKPCFKTV